MVRRLIRFLFFFSSRRRHTRYWRDWSSDVCSSDLLGECRSGKPRAAAEIDGALEKRRLLRGRSYREHRLEQQLRRAVIELAQQRGFEARRVLVEQRPNIAPRHRRQLFRAEPHQPHCGAMAIVGIAVAGVAKRRDRRLLLTELQADFAEGEPGRGKTRRKLGRLREEIGGCDQIAVRLQVAREFETAVGKEIAGRQEQSRGHGLYVR